MRRRNFIRQGTALLASSVATALSWPGIQAFAATGEIPPALSLREEAYAAAGQGLPLVIIFSRRGCTYCEAVKRDYLQPLSTRKGASGRPVVREIRQDSDARMLDFKGEPTTHAAFAAAEQVKLVPVVSFYGPRGRHLSESIVGLRLPDFYQSYLDQALEQASAAIRANPAHP